jgi:NAD(P)-dependent dehydrogenase (short-subunit alcohol dehydrogenase family)
MLDAALKGEVLTVMATALPPHVGGPLPLHAAIDLLPSRFDSRPDAVVSGRASAGKLQGQVAIVTGGEAGLGRATSVLFAREGASMAISYLPEARAEAEITAALVAGVGQQCLLLPGDQRDRAHCDRVVLDTVRHFGRLDILVNNAICLPHESPEPDLDDADWDGVFRAQVYACVNMVRAALPRLGRGAAIVNIGTLAALDGQAPWMDDRAAEAAVHAFTRSLAATVAHRGIRVNAVASDPAAPAVGPAIPLDAIAPAILFLASAGDSSWVTGEILHLRGTAAGA